MENPSKSTRIQHLSEYYLSAVKTDGSDLVTLVFRSRIPQKEHIKQAYVTLFESLLLKAAWSCSSQVSLVKAITEHTQPNGRIELNFDFDSGSLIFGCAEYSVYERNLRLWPGE
jgi:hypothetical protein